MSTRLQLTTVDCDGCGLAVLEFVGEFVGDGVEAALQECGWVPDKAWSMGGTSGTNQSIHLCPVCRPDSPFEAVKRVRALAEQASTVIARGYTCSGDDCTGKCRRGEPMGWDLDPAQVLAALNGESDG